ncbi:MAG: ABC transporter permease [Acidimicrobiia bacterium]|nr:ABC transporter permease [Acidimicrobiia bacterium]
MTARHVWAAFGVVGAARLRRNRFVVAVHFLLPLVFIGVVGVALGGYGDPTFVIGVLDSTGTADTERAIATIEADPDLRVRRYDDDTSLRGAVLRGRVAVGIVFPDVWRPGDDVKVYAGEGESAVPALTLVDAGLAADRAPVTAAELPTVVAVGSQLSSLQVGLGYAAPAMTVQFAIVTGLVLSSTLVELRERGFLARILATPSAVRDVLGQVGAGSWQAAFAQAVFLIVVTSLAFSIEWGDLLGVTLVTVALAGVAMGLSVAFGTLFRGTRQAYTLGPLLAVILGMLGGTFWPLRIVPAPLAVLGHVSPAAWAMDAYTALEFYDASWVDVLADIGVLWVMALTLVTLGALQLRGTLHLRRLAA